MGLCGRRKRKGTWWLCSGQGPFVEGINFVVDSEDECGEEYIFLPDSSDDCSYEGDYGCASEEVEFVPETELQYEEEGEASRPSEASRNMIRTSGCYVAVGSNDVEYRPGEKIKERDAGLLNRDITTPAGGYNGSQNKTGSQDEAREAFIQQMVTIFLPQYESCVKHQQKKSTS